MRRLTFTSLAVAVALSAMPIAPTHADEPVGVDRTPSEHSYFRPLVTNTLFTESHALVQPALLSAPPRLQVTPASFETPPADEVPTPPSRANNLSFLDDPTEASQTSDKAPDLSTLWQLVAVLGVTILACCAVFVKKSIGQKAPGDSGQLELIGTLPLSHRSVIQLVSVGENTVAVASDATGVKSVVLLPPTFSGMMNAEVEAEAQHA